MGDRIAIDGGVSGIVIFSIDTDEFSPEFPAEDWSYLGVGIMVQTEQAGLVHVVESAADIEVID